MWWILLTLIFVGIIFLLIETLLMPGVGIAGILGLLSLGGACWYTFTYIGPAAGRWVTVGVVLAVVALVVFVLRSKTWKKFELDTEVTSKVNHEVDRLKVGDRGIAQTRLAPMGTGKFPAISCEVKSFDNSMVSAGTPLEVIEIEDGKAIVKPINE